MNSAENSNEHTDVLIEENEKREQQTKLFSKEDKAQKPYIFYFNKCFECASFVENAGGYLTQVNNQIKIREQENYVEEINPWNGEINLLERMLNSHDLIMREVKDDGDATRKAKIEASKAM